MHSLYAQNRSPASTPWVVDYGLLDDFLDEVAHHLHSITPGARDRALRLITRQVEIELGIVEVEVAVGADVLVPAFHPNHENKDQ